MKIHFSFICLISNSKGDHEQHKQLWLNILGTKHGQLCYPWKVEVILLMLFFLLFIHCLFLFGGGVDNSDS